MISQKQLTAFIRKCIGPAKMHPLHCRVFDSIEETQWEIKLPTIFCHKQCLELKTELKLYLDCCAAGKGAYMVVYHISGVSNGSVFFISYTPPVEDRNVMPPVEDNDNQFNKMNRALKTLFPKVTAFGDDTDFVWSIVPCRGMTPAGRPELKNRSLLLLGVEAVVEEQPGGHQILWFRKKEKK